MIQKISKFLVLKVKLTKNLLISRYCVSVGFKSISIFIIFII